MSASRIGKRSHRRWVLWAVTAAGCAGAWWCYVSQKHAAKEPRTGSVPPVSLVERTVYRYSVVPGGVRSAAEALAAAAKDAQVRQHYKDLQLARFRPSELRSDLAAHVSFRKNGAIYWTRQKLRVPAGELLLSDGKECIRARCGNRLSLSAQRPTLDEDPPELAFDAIEPSLLDQLGAMPPPDAPPPVSGKPNAQSGAASGGVSPVQFANVAAGGWSSGVFFPGGGAAGGVGSGGAASRQTASNAVPGAVPTDDGSTSPTSDVPTAAPGQLPGDDTPAPSFFDPQRSIIFSGPGIFSRITPPPGASGSPPLVTPSGSAGSGRTPSTSTASESAVVPGGGGGQNPTSGSPLPPGTVVTESGGFSVPAEDPLPVPEPAVLLLTLAGGALMVWHRRRA